MNSFKSFFTPESDIHLAVVRMLQTAPCTAQKDFLSLQERVQPRGNETGVGKLEQWATQWEQFWRETVCLHFISSSKFSTLSLMEVSDVAPDRRPAAGISPNPRLLTSILATCICRLGNSPIPKRGVSRFVEQDFDELPRLLNN